MQKKGFDRVAKILMKRDGFSYEEAIEICSEAKEEMMIALENGDYSEAEDVFYDMIGLELDYIVEFIL